jgi:wyosine [tRNA(Phe)-imidazoG37] synthetase (radical SAM superfamily)
MDDTLRLRDKYFPNAKVSVLSNATHIDRPEVHAALCRVDNNIVKLDTVDIDYIRAIDRPVGHYDLQRLVERMKAFNGHCIIQTMFMKGEFEGRDVDNTTDRYVLPWIGVVKEIAPSGVMIYTIDRETPAHNLRKATHEELDRIVGLLKAEGIEASASY